MKKNILLALVALFGFSNVVLADCTISSGITDFPLAPHADSGDNTCYTEPDFAQYTFYEMGLCTSAAGAPTSSTVLNTANCQTVLSSTSGIAVQVDNGATSDISGNIIRPANGTYTHGYVRVGKAITLRDSREYNMSLDSNYDDAVNGEFCATTADEDDADAVTCSTSAVTAVNSLRSFSFGNDFSWPSGTPTAWLVKSDENLANDSNDVVYLIGTAEFPTPVVLTDDSTSMNIAIKVSNALAVDNRDNTGHRVNLQAGPFNLVMTVK